MLLECAKSASVPAGGALAVDRDVFASCVEKQIAQRDRIEVIRKEVSSIPDGPVVIAAGPLCSATLADAISDLTGSARLSFFDAAAPIVEADSLDMNILFSQSRYEDSATGDYLNAPFSKDEYVAFIEALTSAERVIMKDFETRDLFQACQPAEEVARKGIDAIRFGAMKPVGLTDPRTGRRPWAAVQLRAENRDCTAYNLVGFQTNLTFPGTKTRVSHDSRAGACRVLAFWRHASQYFHRQPPCFGQDDAYTRHKSALCGPNRRNRGATPRRLLPVRSQLSTPLQIFRRATISELPNTDRAGVPDRLCNRSRCRRLSTDACELWHHAAPRRWAPPFQTRPLCSLFPQRGKDALERVIRDRGDLF